MSKELTDVSDRCGSCKFFMYRVINDTLKKWGGQCTKPNRKTYHDRSQKACKLYEPYNELEELDIKVEEDIPTVQAVPIKKIKTLINDIEVMRTSPALIDNDDVQRFAENVLYALNRLIEGSDAE